MAAPKWKVAGDYFEACNCNASCPCIFLSPPTEGYCDGEAAWHIEKGSFGEVELDGFNVMMAFHAPGTMIDGGWKVALYIDDRGNTQQQEALAQIFSGQAGGQPAALASLVKEVLGVGPATIDYKINGKKRSLKVAGISEAEVEEVEGAGGKRIEIHNAPMALANPEIQAKSVRARLSDKGLSFDLAGKNSFIAPFTYEGP